jgi:hypothetical protein
MYAEQDPSEALLAMAFEEARLVGMSTRAFADMAVENDPVVAES